MAYTKSPLATDSSIAAARDCEDLDRLYLGAEEVGRRIGISAAYVRKLIAAGRLPVVRLGGRTLVPTARLERFAAELLAEGRL